MEPYELLQKVVKVLESLHIPYLVTGSVAAMAYGEPRFTNDIDIVAGTDESHIAGLMTSFSSDEFYIDGEMIRQAVREHAQFNIIHPASGLKIDIMIRKDVPFDQSRFARLRRLSPAESYQANFASPEDVIIKKMEYYQAGGSDKHLRDIASILKISGDEVDENYISEWAEQLGLSDIWQAVQKRLCE